MTIPEYSSSNEKNGRHIVLFVEDERFVREATCRILQNARFEVLSAADAEEAMQLYEENRSRIDLLMTDLILLKETAVSLGSNLPPIAGNPYPLDFRVPVLGGG